MASVVGYSMNLWSPHEAGFSAALRWVDKKTDNTSVEIAIFIFRVVGYGVIVVNRLFSKPQDSMNYNNSYGLIVL